jgi:hypothetical protein
MREIANGYSVVSHAARNESADAYERFYKIQLKIGTRQTRIQ